MHALLSRSRLFRLFTGAVLVALLLWMGFAITLRLLPFYGATEEERSYVLPGDDILKRPAVIWNHGITINAPVHLVWPWIIQMGDDRAGFYSYTFIEKAIDPDPSHYINADRVREEWQQPRPGTWIIQNALQIKEYEEEHWMLASVPTGGSIAEGMPAMGWTWLWRITRYPEGKTRLNIHMRIENPTGMDNSLLGTVINLGGFVMERRMMDGIKLRAEGGFEPPWIEAAEICLWFAVLALGKAAAWRFVFGPRGRVEWKALLAGLAAGSLLFVFTFLQPAVWLRALIVLALAAVVVWSWRPLPFRVGIRRSGVPEASGS